MPDVAVNDKEDAASEESSWGLKQNCGSRSFSEILANWNKTHFD
jgi:hypothetical protein